VTPQHESIHACNSKPQKSGSGEISFIVNENKTSSTVQAYMLGIKVPTLYVTYRFRLFVTSNKYAY